MKSIEKLYNENLELKRVRLMLVRDLEKVSETLDRFLNNFGTVLLNKQFKIERLKNKLKQQREK